MKFIHIADVHWGMTPDSDKPWCKERAQAIKDTFSNVIQKTKELDVDCLFIAGDLFHRQPLITCFPRYRVCAWLSLQATTTAYGEALLFTALPGVPMSHF